MTQAFLGVEEAAAPGAYRLPITPDVCVGPAGNVFMFGGVGLAAAIVAAEQSTGREAIWASAHFLSYARPGELLDICVEELVPGRNVTQARIVATRGDVPVLNVSAALGTRAGQPEDQWLHAPDMPPPDVCVPQPLWPTQDAGATLMRRLDVRLAPGSLGERPRDGTRDAEGRMTMWMRLRDGTPIDAAALAIFADFVPSGVAAAFGRPGGGNSLDNTLRLVRLVPTEWVLCEVRASGGARGFGHGAIHMFAQDGTLLATGSQSAILRFADNNA